MNQLRADAPPTSLYSRAAAAVATAAQPTDAIRFLGVTRRFGAVSALDGIDLSIQGGETVALLGPNGAGKTTAVGLILGLLEPTTGSVETLGLRPTSAIASGRVGAMLQNSALPTCVRVDELVDFTRQLYPHPLALDDILERAGLAPLRRRRTDLLSGGEAQRVRFAMAIAGDPDLMLLDEPTVAMDVEARRAFWAHMRRSAAEGRTILFATHYLEEADQVADRVIVLDHGHVVADGTGREIRGRVHDQTVRFELAGADPATLRALPSVIAVDVHGDRVRLTTTDADQTVRAIYAAAMPIRALEVTGADLEDAFIALTGNHDTTRETIE